MPRPWAAPSRPARSGPGPGPPFLAATFAGDAWDARHLRQRSPGAVRCWASVLGGHGVRKIGHG